MAEAIMLGQVLTSTEEWIARFMGVASMVATWSKDRDRQVGALAVIDKGRTVAWGYNGFPEGVLDLQQRIKGPEKNKLTIHAEVNALNNARFPVEGCDLFVTSHPCLACALHIISKRVARVFCPRPEEGSRWLQSQQEAAALLEEVGIEVVHVEPGGAGG